MLWHPLTLSKDYIILVGLAVNQFDDVQFSLRTSKSSSGATKRGGPKQMAEFNRMAKSGNLIAWIIYQSQWYQQGRERSRMASTFFCLSSNLHYTMKQLLSDGWPVSPIYQRKRRPPLSFIAKGHSLRTNTDIKRIRYGSLRDLPFTNTH